MLMDKNDVKFPLGASTGGFSFLLMLAVYLVLSLVGQLIVGAVFPSGGVLATAINSTYAVIAMLGVIIYLSKKGQISIIKATSVKKFNVKYLIYSLVLSLGMFFGLGFLNTVFVNLLDKLGVSVSGINIPLDNVCATILFLFVLAVFPAILEEAFFRGLMLNCLNNVKPIISSLFIALCFSLYHCSLAQLLYQFVYGFALSVLVITAKSIIPSVIAHFINNGAVILLQYCNVYVDLFNPLIIISGLLLLVLFFVGTFLNIKNQYSKKEYKDSERCAKTFWVPYAVFGSTICVLIAVLSLF